MNANDFSINWLSSEKGESFELKLSDGVLLYVEKTQHSNANQTHRTWVTILNSRHLNKLKSNPKLMKDWMSEILKKEKSKLRFRLLGDPEYFSLLSNLLLDLGCSTGRDVALAMPTLLHYFASEGRIRAPKQTISQIANQPKLPKSKTRVLIVDDSLTIRNLLTKVISESEELECVGAIGSPDQVEDAIIRLKPEVLTLDIHMPGMDGVTLLKQLLPKYKLPTIMISSLSLQEGHYVLDALAIGAVDYIQKPSFEELHEIAPILHEKLLNARFAKIIARTSEPENNNRTANLEDGIDTTRLICFGSSTGGTEALKTILLSLPQNIPPILIVQHIPPIFSKAFADRLNSLCPFKVNEAEHGSVLQPGNVYIAPGGKQMRVKKSATNHVLAINDSQPVNRHCPSIDVLFDSVAGLGKTNITAALLTGMGTDGAKGLLKLRQIGAETFAQDEASCVVFGMPKEAIRIGAAKHVLALDQLGPAIIQSAKKDKT